MRLIPPLQKASALALLLVLACSSRATTTASYSEHRDPTAHVASPQLEVAAGSEDLSFTGHWGADVVTAATPVMAAPDAYTRATEFSETRHEAALFADWQGLREQGWSTGYRISVEGDYLSQSGSASISHDLLDRHLTLSAGASAGFDQIGRADVAGFSENMWSTGLTLGATQVLGPDLLGHLTYDLEGRFGYQANPYRLVPVYENRSPSPSVVLAERHPERRLRHALEPLVVWAPTPSLFVHGSYRLYGDDWGLWSHTIRTEIWAVGFADLVRGRLRARAYHQRGARFYRARYDELEPYRSGDYRLSDMNSLSAGARLDLRPTIGDRQLTLSTSYDLSRYGFANYAPRKSMIAHSWGLSMSMEWQ